MSNRMGISHHGGSNRRPRRYRRDQNKAAIEASRSEEDHEATKNATRKGEEWEYRSFDGVNWDFYPPDWDEKHQNLERKIENGHAI